MDDATRIRRLAGFNYLWLSILVLGALMWLVSWQVTGFQARRETVKVLWEADGGITFTAMSDGPFVITHLILVQSTETQSEMTIAQLPEPVVIIESGRVSLSSGEVTKIIWYERSSRERVASPKQGTPIQALYYKARKTDQAHQR